MNCSSANSRFEETVNDGAAGATSPVSVGTWVVSESSAVASGCTCCAVRALAASGNTHSSWTLAELKYCSSSLVSPGETMTDPAQYGLSLLPWRSGATMAGTTVQKTEVGSTGATMAVTRMVTLEISTVVSGYAPVISICEPTCRPNVLAVWVLITPWISGSFVACLSWLAGVPSPAFADG